MTPSSHRCIQFLVRALRFSATTPQDGLVVKSGIEANRYEKGIKVADNEMRKLSLTRDNWHGDWNDIISPQNYMVFLGRYYGTL
ncbi:MAG: hypothetical protein J5803_06355 [Desulfovibrio sp.]|nr:hypothetical protein [Desulfovibrio sp.]